MIITLTNTTTSASFTLNDANDSSTRAWLTQIDGLELPKIRTSTGNYAGTDGGWVGAQFFSARDVSLQGLVLSQDVAELESTRSSFQDVLASKMVKVVITTNAGNVYVFYANVIDFSMPIGKKIWSAKYKLELVAPDPTLYLHGSELNVALSPIDPGGFDWPVDWPITYAGGSTPTSIVNSGGVAVYPTVTLTGTMTNPVLTNQTSGLYLGLTLTTGSSDVVVIDMATHTITLNGANIYGDMTSGSSFWSLATGSNSIALSTSSLSDTVTAQLKYQAGVMGI